MLKGEAKTAYMRRYMRLRRAGLPTTKPKPPKEPKELKPNQRRIEREAARHDRFVSFAASTAPEPLRCSFCHKSKTSERMLWGNESDRLLICNVCVADAADAFHSRRDTWALR
jgi:ClpX C4-type zinc finger